MNPIDLLLSGDMRPARDLAVDTILHERKALIDQLILVMEDEKHGGETRSAAAFILGEFRAVEAIPALSRALALRRPWWPVISGNINRFDSPVFTALIKIGRPAVPAMLENVENSDNEVLRKKSVIFLGQTLGGKRRLLDVLEKCQTRATDETVKRRLGVAIEWVEKEFREDEEPLY